MTGQPNCMHNVWRTSNAGHARQRDNALSCTLRTGRCWSIVPRRRTQCARTRGCAEAYQRKPTQIPAQHTPGRRRKLLHARSYMKRTLREDTSFNAREEYGRGDEHRTHGAGRGRDADDGLRLRQIRVRLHCVTRTEPRCVEWSDVLRPYVVGWMVVGDTQPAP